MISPRPRLILGAMVGLAIVLGVMLFVHPLGNGVNHPENPAPHAPDQTPR
jgi:hypothetical protein